jgi:hypothetical protein
MEGSLELDTVEDFGPPICSWVDVGIRSGNRASTDRGASGAAEPAPENPRPVRITSGLVGAIKSIEYLPAVASCGRRSMLLCSFIQRRIPHRRINRPSARITL